ncbi:hypothetical protein BDA99DRAFT_595299, partial [Phascolomyces articulosus]
MKHLFSADECQHEYNRTNEIQHDEPLECTSEFKATKNANHNNSSNFHETGLLGSICVRHDVPLEFTNLYQSGEKFLYALSIMNVFTNTYPGIKIDTIMYDICCRVEPTLTVNVYLNDWRTKFAVSVFHSYAHNFRCQI